MKRLVLFLAVLVALTRPAQAKLRVVSSLQDFASIADAIGGDRVDVFAIAKGYQDPHFVDAKPSFILKLSNADVLIVAGLELEIGYLPPLIDQSRNDKIRPGSPGYLTPRSAATSSSAPRRRSRARWATSIPTATRTTGPIPTTVG